MSTIQSKFVQLGDLRIHYKETAGNDDLPPLVCLHGWPTNAELYRNVMPGLSSQRRVIALDFPGFGESDKPEKIHYAFKFYDRFLSDFFAALNIDDVGLVVHDLGGPVGLHWAVNNPKRVRELVVLNTLAYPNFHWTVTAFVAGLNTPLLRDMLTTTAAVAFTMRFGVKNKNAMSKEVLKIYTTPFKDAGTRRLLQKFGGELVKPGFQEIADGLAGLSHVPTALMYGAGDRILPDVGKTMARLNKVWPASEVIALPNAGHFLQEDAPEDLTRLIGEFLAQQPS